MKSRKGKLLVGLLLTLVLVAVACSDDDKIADMEAQISTLESQVTTLGGEVEAAKASAADQGDSRLDLVKARGKLICAGRTDLPGFGFLDDAGNNSGFDIDLCRAVAAAIFGDSGALEVLPITASERGPSIQGGEPDILSRNVTWTSSRDAQWGNYTVTMFYDGQGFMAQKALGFNSALDLDGTTVCVTSGTTTELNVADFFRQHNMQFEAVIFEDSASVYGAYEEGRCDVTTSDKSQLAAIRSGFADPDAHVILPETISKEPLTPVVAHGDDEWFDLVKIVMYTLINAEELGVTQANVGTMSSSDNIQIRRMLGAEGEFGQADVGLGATFAVDVIKAVGNYGEIYDRYMGPNGRSFTLPRAGNQLWSDGGLIYAPPLK